MTSLMYFILKNYDKQNTHHHYFLLREVNIAYKDCITPPERLSQKIRSVWLLSQLGYFANSQNML